MQHKKTKQITLLFSLMLFAIGCFGGNYFDGHSHIVIKEAQVQGVP